MELTIAADTFAGLWLTFKMRTKICKKVFVDRNDS